jgi:hypothetical protein
MRWTRELFDAMSPHFHGVYVNNLGEEGSNRVQDAYGINLGQPYFVIWRSGDQLA